MVEGERGGGGGVEGYNLATLKMSSDSGESTQPARSH